jgi:hypothetical protein
VVKGKFSYLSPEAASGIEVDHRADVFAVGIILWELFTGRRLFYGETDYQTVELVRNAKIPPIKPQNPQVEPELEDIVRKALAKRKEDRYQNAGDVQDALAQYSYSRGLKVISRDIAELVRQCLEDKRMQSSEGKSKTSIIDHLLQDEIVKFTSVDFEDPGAQPLTADELAPRDAAAGPPGGGDFIDPRGWADERHTPVLGVAEVDLMEARQTTRDIPAGAAAAAKSAAQAKGPAQPPARGPAPPPQSPKGPAQPAKGPPQPGAPTAPALGTKTGPRRVGTGENRTYAPPVAPPGSTPGPESLAAVLEPTPGPEALVGVLEPDAARRPAAPAPGPRANRPGRSFLIGMAIGAVILGAAIATVVSKKNATPAPAHPTARQTP